MVVRLLVSVGWVAGICSCVGSGGGPRPIYLVKDRMAVGEFVLSTNASKAESFGTADVCHWVEAMTGAQVPVVSGVE